MSYWQPQTQQFDNANGVSFHTGVEVRADLGRECNKVKIFPGPKIQIIVKNSF